MSFIYSMADTWNAIGTTFNAIQMTISNGAGGAPVGAAASRALKLISNTTNIFEVDISGNTGLSAPNLAANGSATRRYLTIQGTNGAGAIQLGANTAGQSVNGLIEWFDIGNTSSAILRNALIYSGSEGSSPNNLGGNLIFATKQDGVSGGGTQRMKIDGAGNVGIGGGSALATTATDGFLFIPTCAGTPTGVPSNAVPGTIPIVFDTTGHILWAYEGGAWKQPKTIGTLINITWQ